MSGLYKENAKSLDTYSIYTIIIGQVIKDALYTKFCIVFLFNDDNSSALIIHVHPIDTRICMVPYPY